MTENVKEGDDREQIEPMRKKGDNEVATNAGSGDHMWISDLHLFKEQEAQLLQGMWLDDAVINAARTLLKTQFPTLSGFQSTQVVAANRADVLGGGAIQIVHTRTNNWVCIHVEEDRAGVRLYNSLYSSIPMSTVDHILQLVHPMTERISIKSMMMQTQKGSSDCGLFAVAVATALCHHYDPTVCRWIQEDMRQQLASCLVMGEITPFPAAEEKPEQRGGVKKCHSQAVHCVCRKRHKRKERMNQCCQCQGWFHETCLTIPVEVFKNSSPWSCNRCH